MNVLIAFLFLSFIMGGSSRGRVIRDRPILLAAFAGLFAASFYSLRVVM